MKRLKTPCVVWEGLLDPYGYGILKINGRRAMAHRVAYEREVGPIPEGMQIDHLCRNRACVNVAHMEVVTQAENMRRGNSPSAINARKTHCLNGHPLDGPNADVYRYGNRRRCRRCVRMAASK